jgi:hypothetical protein
MFWSFGCGRTPQRCPSVRTRSTSSVVDDQVGEVLSLMAQSTKLSRAVRSIYMKLGVSNRRLAVLTAHDRGLLNNSVR